MLREKNFLRELSKKETIPQYQIMKTLVSANIWANSLQIYCVASYLNRTIYVYGSHPTPDTPENCSLESCTKDHPLIHFIYHPLLKEKETDNIIVVQYVCYSSLEALRDAKGDIPCRPNHFVPILCKKEFTYDIFQKHKPALKWLK